MRIVVTILGILRPMAQKLGPYLLLEVLLPGGTLLALLLSVPAQEVGISGSDGVSPLSSLHPAERLCGISMDSVTIRSEP
jgi:hypothetical protein